MRRSCLLGALGVMGVTLCAGNTIAQTVLPGAEQPGWSVFKNHDSTSRTVEKRHDHHRGRNRDTIELFWGFGYPLLWGGYTPAFGRYQPIYPFSVQRGFSAWAPTPVPATASPPVNPPAPAARPKTPNKPKARTSNVATKARAGKFIGFGDVNFEKQSYLSALERYKTAARIAPDVAESYFRQGFALVALGNYQSAAKAFRRGLATRSDWSGSPFRLDKLYQDNRVAKNAHFESLAMAIEANPLDADLLMLLGLEIFFDGQAERSEVFFARVAQLGGNEDKLLDSFLPHPGPAGAPKPKKAAKRDDKVVF